MGHVLPLYKYKEINIINAFPARRNKKLLNNFNCETFTTKFNGNIFNYSFFCCNFMDFLLQEVLESISMKIYTYSYVSKMKRSETDLCTTELIYNMLYTMYFINQNSKPKFNSKFKITNPMGVIGSWGIGPTYATEHRFICHYYLAVYRGFKLTGHCHFGLLIFRAVFLRRFVILPFPFRCKYRLLVQELGTFA